MGRKARMRKGERKKGGELERGMCGEIDRVNGETEFWRIWNGKT